MGPRVGVPVLGLVLAAAFVPAATVAQEEAPPRRPSVELPAELDRVLGDYERAWDAGDAQALAGLFTEDGFVSNGSGWIRGRDEIRAEYARAGGPLRLRALEWATAGEVGWIVGAYGYGPEASERDAGKFVLALRRGADGRWLIAADLDNSNRSPGG
jgi:ketosteroid isomerase-like protein